LPLKRPALLIAAVTGRAIAQSARRAGFVPLVADFFADLDTQSAAHACRKLEGDIARGIEWPSLSRALEALAAESPSPILGLVYGSGFEDRPKLLTGIAKSWPLLGNDEATVAYLKDHESFFGELDRLGVAHPATASKRPAMGGASTWLIKRKGGAGGSHIGVSGTARPRGRVYYQERVEGRAISMLFVANGREARLLGFSEQWTAPSKQSPWRYGGAVRPARLAAAEEEAMTSAVERATFAFKINGLASADFMVDGQSALLLEINPRPGATLDIFDSPASPLIGLHVDAVMEAKLPRAAPSLEGAMGSAIVFARKPVAVPLAMSWPVWVGDRPRPGEIIDKNRPICTVWARAGTKARAKSLVEARTKTVLACIESKCRGITVNKMDKKAEGSAVSQGELPSVNTRVEPVVKSIIEDVEALRVDVTEGSLGECRIDCGVRAIGGLEAGRRIAEVCLGGLGRVSLETTDTDSAWPFVVTVHTSQPVIACLGSQYAGWSLSVDDNGKKYNVLGSGPARAMGSSEKLFDELGYRDKAASAVLVIEADRAPPPALVKEVAKACKLPPERLTFIYAPTSSLAGTVQIAARCLEVALHKAHELHFPLDHIIDGIATAPLPPPAPSFIEAMGRTNDAIIYGGRVQLFVSGDEKEAKAVADALPSLKSKDYGRPFAEIFAAVKGDFYAIDRMLFSPAMVTVTALKSGKSFEAGRIDQAVLSRSFS
jgi:methenyltetrahydromethanopterin cyclohydrolase